MNPSSDSLVEAAQQVMETYLDAELAPRPLATTNEPGPSLVGCVLISGSWQGALTLEMPNELARDLAAAMFQTERSDARAEDVRDALGELTNQIAGVLKGSLATGSQLSMPTVTEGGDYVVTVVGSAPLVRAELSAGGHGLRIVLHERSSKERRAVA